MCYLDKHGEGQAQLDTDKHGEGQAQLDTDKHGEGQALALQLLEDARWHAETAVRLAPDERNYWDTLAHVYALLGLDKKAQHASQKAMH